MDEYRIAAHAKINLGLDVVRRLPDGYHQVKMVMLSLGLCDELTLRKAEGGITITADDVSLPTDKSNLIYKAARLMFEKYEIPEGIHIRLQKRIPIAAGMAGGSADAAAAMKGIDRLYQLGLSEEQLMADGVSIGADVPYCILGGTALAEGIGEKLTPLPALPPCHILVAKPDISVSTKYVYEHLDLRAVERHPDIDGMVQAVSAGDLQGILNRMENVLETVTVPAYPIINEIKQEMLESGAANSLMSGSGPTVFGIFTDEPRAQAAFLRLTRGHLANQVFLTTAV